MVGLTIKGVRSKWKQRRAQSLPPPTDAIESLWDEPAREPPAPWSAEGVSEQLDKLARTGTLLARIFIDLYSDVTAKFVYGPLALRDAFRDLQLLLVALLTDLGRVHHRIAGLIKLLVTAAADLHVTYGSEHQHRSAIGREEHGVAEDLDTASRQLIIVRREWTRLLPMLASANAPVSGSIYAEACSPTGVALDTLAQVMDEQHSVLQQQQELWLRHLMQSWSALPDDRVLSTADEWAPLSRLNVLSLTEWTRRVQATPSLPVPPYEPELRKR